MKPDHHIRAYQPSDREVLLELLQLNVPTYFAASELEDFSHYLETELEQYFVIELGNQVIGAGGINFDNNGKVGKISWDFIAPEFQHKGVGKKLLEHRIELLKSMKNVEKIIVRTSQLAYQFYQKNGFSLKEKVDDYWAPGFHLYYMELDSD